MIVTNRKLDHISISVPNLQDAIAFYTEVLGYQVVNQFKGDMEFVFVSDGNVIYELLEKTMIQETKIDHIAYVSLDIKADYEHFEKLGLVTTNIGYIDYLFENGMYYFFIKGPGNAKIEYCQKKEN